MRGEKIYAYDLTVTGMTDYGITLEAILSGATPIPAQGVRLDVAFDGNAKGRLSGRVHGVDYVRVRADGRVDLDIRAAIETDDGHRIALRADGVAIPRATEPAADLFENVTLDAVSEQYAWVNTRQIWAVGTIDFTSGRIHIDGYLQ